MLAIFKIETTLEPSRLTMLFKSASFLGEFIAILYVNLLHQSDFYLLSCAIISVVLTLRYWMSFNGPTTGLARSEISVALAMATEFTRGSGHRS